MTQTNYYSEDKKLRDANRLRELKLMVDPRYLIDSLGFDDPKETSKEIRCACLIHGGDNKSAFKFNKEKRSWVCFTHGCHENSATDILGLIMAVLDLDFIGARKYLSELVGDVSAYRDRVLEDKFKQERNNFIKNNGGPLRPSFVSEGNLKKYKVLRSDRFIKDGYNPATLDYFEVAGGYVDKVGTIRDIIPIRNAEGELVSYSLRDVRDDLTEEEKHHKYILTPDFDKNNVLYNLNNALIFGSRFPIIVVEGFKSVWKFYECGIYNVVAIIGTAILDGQKKLLKAYATNGVVLMFDGDDPGRVATQRALDFIGNDFKVHPVYIREDGLDPSELTVEQIYGYLNEFIQ